MSAKEYIADLKAQHLRKQLEPNDISANAAARIRFLNLDIAEVLEQANATDYAERIYDVLQPRLPAAISERFREGQYAVGTIFDGDFGMYVRTVEGGGKAIVIRDDLRSFVYRVARVVATRVQPMPAAAEPPPDEAVTFEETARHLYEIFWWLNETNQSFGGDYPITPEQQLFAARMTDEAFIFLLGHEIGHVVADESPNDATAFGQLVAPNTQTDHLDEFVADRIGIMLSLLGKNSDSGRDANEIAIAYAGAELVLQIWHALEVLGLSPDNTHPPAVERLFAMRATARDLCDSEDVEKIVTSMSQAFDVVFNNLLEAINDPVFREKHFEIPGAAVLHELDALLDECSAEQVPDYSTFSFKVVDILNRGYPQLIGQRVSEIAEAFYSIVAAGEDSQRDGAAAYRVFSKFKLLYSYVSKDTPEPVRSYLMAALQVTEAAES